MPLPDDIFAVLNGGIYFSKLDLSDVYLQVEIDDKSNKYSSWFVSIRSFTFFLQTMDIMLADLLGAVSNLDDIIVMGCSKQNHDENLNAVLQRIQEWGFHLRVEKCSFRLEQIRYLGYIIDRHGRRPKMEKVKAIHSMPEPHNITTLKSFLGIINYYGQFINDFRSIIAPLDKLLRKVQKFIWSKECRIAFNKAKSILLSGLTLTHLDPSKDVIVAGDASNFGIGGVIMHRFPDGTHKAIAHVSRSLTKTRKNAIFTVTISTFKQSAT